MGLMMLLRLVPLEATTQLEHCGARRTRPLGIMFNTVRTANLGTDSFQRRLAYSMDGAMYEFQNRG